MAVSANFINFCSTKTCSSVGEHKVTQSRAWTTRNSSSQHQSLSRSWSRCLSRSRPSERRMTHTKCSVVLIPRANATIRHQNRTDLQASHQWGQAASLVDFRAIRSSCLNRSSKTINSWSRMTRHPTICPGDSSLRYMSVKSLQRYERSKNLTRLRNVAPNKLYSSVRRKFWEGLRVLFWAYSHFI